MWLGLIRRGEGISGYCVFLLCGIDKSVKPVILGTKEDMAGYVGSSCGSVV